MGGRVSTNVDHTQMRFLSHEQFLPWLLATSDQLLIENLWE